MDGGFQLTETEKAAKAFTLNLLLKGFQPSELCDVKFTDEMYRLPHFYDHGKFKRGQKYFMDNRFGIMQSNLYGLFSLICEPNGAKLLDRTDHSSTPDSARKRYADTTLHMLSWCTDDLKPGSRSWESLKRVRKMHLAASNASLERTKRGIPQAYMTFTAFGFMGYALVKPHLLAIRHDSVEDREAYVHMWAVICSMLGIKDEFNLCLNRLDVVEIICHILIRYNFTPLLQLETKVFEKLGRAFIEGMKWYVPFSTYESRLFLARRLAGIPGYQYDVDFSKEYHIRQIFTREELISLKREIQEVEGFEYRRGFIWDENIPIINTKDITDYENSSHEKADYNSNKYGTYRSLDVVKSSRVNRENALVEILELKHPSELEIIEVNDANIHDHLNDSKFKELSKNDQFLVKFAVRQAKVNQYFLTRYLSELTLGFVLNIMEKKNAFLTRPMLSKQQTVQ